MQEEDNNGIESIDSTSETNHHGETKDNDYRDNNGEANIESLIPSTVYTIPFP
jgi:hypothetical protein